jgi:EAL and modified HD-GYP domain-containing signal transduction protein
MAATVLGNISLGYQLLWSRHRLPVAVQLFVDTDAAVPVDASHLLSALSELWPGRAPTLLLEIHSLPLLQDLLEHGRANDPWLQVPESLLGEPALRQRVQKAHLRGLKMVWCGGPGQRPEAATAPCFHKCMIKLSANAAVSEPHASLKGESPSAGTAALKSPSIADQICEAVASRAMAEDCLDRQDAWAIAGWPVEDVLRGYQHKAIEPALGAIKRLLKSIEDDASLETIEHFLSEEPVLAYRFLRHVNSAKLGLRSEVESIWRGLMVLGYSALETWLRSQLPQASGDLNLQPVHTTIVTRAHLMERLMDAGEEDELRREVYLCGLLSHIDRLLGEPLETALQRLPLSERVHAALLQRAGPYSPYLEIAAALESPRTRATHELCDTHGLNLEDVNRALLRTLTALPARTS